MRGRPDVDERAVAAVVYCGPNGPEGLLVTAGMGPAVPFGRGGHCPVRFGHGPDLDRRLARQAGSFVIAGDRLAVESSPSPDHLPVQVRAAETPSVELARGELYAPAASLFDVVVRGERTWRLTVRSTFRAGAVLPGHERSGDEPATERPSLVLTGHERRLLEAYVAPMRNGGFEPSTHGEVARLLNYSANKVRGDLYALWAKMVGDGLPVPSFTDKRMAVARAALSNGLV